MTFAIASFTQSPTSPRAVSSKPLCWQKASICLRTSARLAGSDAIFNSRRDGVCRLVWTVGFDISYCRLRITDCRINFLNRQATIATRQLLLFLLLFHPFVPALHRGSALVFVIVVPVAQGFSGQTLQAFD